MTGSDDQMAEIRFPAISVTRAGEILVHRGRETLERGYQRMFRSGWYAGMRIIDVEGRDRKVVRARKLGGYGRLWGFSLIFSRRIRLHFQLESLGRLNVAEVKEVICDSMTRAPHLWEASAEGLSGWQSRVKRTRSLAEIVAVLESSGTVALAETIPRR